MRVVNFVLAAMFLVFAFVQVNDPDPVIWILIYGTMAVFSIMAIFEFYPKKFLIGMLILFVFYGLFNLVYHPGFAEWLRSDNKSSLFDNVAKMENLYIEESREFLGLMICVIVLTFHLVSSRKS